jgi:uncharacterized protein (TIGR01319 family)
MKVDAIVADIGSTFTKVNCFNFINTPPRYLGKGSALTTIELNDVTLGLDKAIKNLKINLKTDTLSWKDMIVTCSAAGGLVMSVHGLVYDMTVKAAKEAALGAGGVLKFSTAGRLCSYDIQQIEKIKPKILMLTGGVDNGEQEIIIHNAMLISKAMLRTPVIYAGNQAIRNQIKEIFKAYNGDLIISENVYPDIDQLNIKPAKRHIYETFEKNITKSPGMEKIFEYTQLSVLPTPLAVMKMSELIERRFEDLLVIDIGGATTDIHSITNGNPTHEEKLISPEPREKRTVEGDLGLYLNKDNIFQILTEKEKKKFAQFNIELEYIKPIPSTTSEETALIFLATRAIKEAIIRHAGKIKYEFSSKGKNYYCEGKDLSTIKHVIGTGGFFSYLYNYGININDLIPCNISGLLLPDINEINFHIDKQYLMSSLGALSVYYPEEASEIFANNI